MNRFEYEGFVIQEEKARSSAREGYEPNALGFLTSHGGRGGDGHTVRRDTGGTCIWRVYSADRLSSILRTCGKGLMRCEPLLEPVDQGGGDPSSDEAVFAA